MISGIGHYQEPLDLSIGKNRRKQRIAKLQYYLFLNCDRSDCKIDKSSNFLLFENFSEESRKKIVYKSAETDEIK